MRKHKRGSPLEETEGRETVVIPSGDRRTDGDTWDASKGAGTREEHVAAIPEEETEYRPADARQEDRRSRTSSPRRPPRVNLRAEPTVEETDAETVVLGVLVAIQGPIPGFVARLFDGENVLGRLGDPDPIPDQRGTTGISRRHARVWAAADGFVVEPSSDRSAVFVNEIRIRDRALVSQGDRIRLGRDLTFVLLVVP